MSPQEEMLYEFILRDARRMKAAGLLDGKRGETCREKKRAQPASKERVNRVATTHCEY